ncbi:MAG: phosphoenolpyruvate synthase regulatory protein [Rhodospirillaceae bacterium]|nr:MAG: phosphoenolpyruvate synthase regulatory protein [Rhodospirillaceae bacterium]
MTTFILHKISDSTGQTLDVLARACMAQFADVIVEEKRWTHILDKDQVKLVLAEIKKNPGFVIFTVVDDELSEQLVLGCKKLQVPCIDLLNPVLSQMGNYLGLIRESRPGSQHVMDGDYYAKVDALHYVLAHDEGQSLNDIDEADVILVGVSRTTKTPTSIYLANRGYKTANVPFILGMQLPKELIAAERPLVIGITKDPERLVHIRIQRLELQGHSIDTDYTDIEAVTEEIVKSKQVCEDHGWPIIDVTKQSVEETADTIIQMLNTRLDGAV